MDVLADGGCGWIQFQLQHIFYLVFPYFLWSMIAEFLRLEGLKGLRGAEGGLGGNIKAYREDMMKVLYNLYRKTLRFKLILPTLWAMGLLRGTI